MSGPNLTAGTYDSTSHDTTGGYKTFITGLKDAGEVTFKLFFDPAAATHNDATGGLVDAFKNNLVNYWKIAMGNVSPAATWTFRACVTKLDFQYPVDGPQTANCTVKISVASTLA
jgi:predicted secreted protein